MDIWLLLIDLQPSPIGLLFPVVTLVVLVVAFAMFVDFFGRLRELRRRR